MRWLPVILPLGLATAAGIWLAVELLLNRRSRIDFAELTLDEFADTHPFVDGD